MPGLTETSYGSGGAIYPRANNNHPYWACRDPLNPNRIYLGYIFDSNVYVTYKADFPSSTRNAYDSGYNTPTNMFNITYDGNYFYGSQYAGSNSKLYQMYVGDHKGPAFQSTGLVFDAIPDWDYYPHTFYHAPDNAYYTQRKSKAQTAKRNMSVDSTCQSYPDLHYLCVAGGGGGGEAISDGSGGIGGGGGGAGGLQTSYGSATGGGNDVVNGPLELVPGTYTITIGAGGAGYSNGNNSSIAHPSLTTIESFKGGAGGRRSGNNPGGGNGTFGSGGGDATDETGGPGKGTTGQGQDGGPTGGSGTGRSSAGGGGSWAAGGAITSTRGGNGGNGTYVTISGSSTHLAGGGGGGGGGTGSKPGGAGSAGGGNGGATFGGGNGNNASGYTGSGGGGAGGGTSTAGTPGNGGGGQVILRLATSLYSGTTTGSPIVTTSGSDTIIQFIGSGTYVHS